MKINGLISSASPHKVLDIRKKTLGYVSQFLRVIPRISAIDLVCEPLLVQGKLIKPAKAQAKKLLNKLSIPDHYGICRLQPFQEGSSNASI